MLISFDQDGNAQNRQQVATDDAAVCKPVAMTDIRSSIDIDLARKRGRFFEHLHLAHDLFQHPGGEQPVNTWVTLRS